MKESLLHDGASISLASQRQSVCEGKRETVEIRHARVLHLGTVTPFPRLNEPNSSDSRRYGYVSAEGFI